MIVTNRRSISVLRLLCCVPIQKYKKRKLKL